MRWVKIFFSLGVIFVTLFFSLGPAAQEIPLEKKVISLDFKNIDVQDALRLISVQSGISIVVDPEVEGRPFLLSSPQ